MDAEALWLDGNALAGILGEAFGTEMTSVRRGCPTCGVRSAIGAHRAYRGAGAVLRCPACGDLALRVATLADRYVVRMSGTWTLELPRA
jgi:predicted RNA-binding Zn-ribbon protein involved in translation (DUF1610 family)